MTPALPAILTFDASGTIHYASESVCDMFGWAPAEVLGEHYKTLLAAERGGKDGLEEFMVSAAMTAETAAARQPSMHRLNARRKDGSIIPIDVIAGQAGFNIELSPLFVAIVKVADTAKPGSSDAELERTLRLVAAQTCAITDANLSLRLRDRMASIVTLAAGLGHDMNNVLLPMRAHLNAVQARHCLPSGVAHVESIRRSVGYLQQLSDGLHYLSLDPRGENHKAATNLSRWWEQVGGLISKAVPHNVKVSASLPRTLPEVSIAPHSLTQAMLNLLVNAGEAIEGMPASPARRGKGGKELDGQIQVSAKLNADKSKVILAVADTGRGMTQDVLRRAFELFYTTKTRGLGTGLGLSLVHRVISGTGGTVEIESTPGKGTTVTMSIPVAVASATQDKGAFGGPIAQPNQTHSRRNAVLSISNGRVSAMVRLMMEANVRLGGAAREGQTPVEVVIGQTPGNADIWATDPTADALRTAMEWRGRSTAKRIVLSGPPPQEDAQKWSELGAFNIEDVTDLDSIRSAVRQALTI